MFKVPRKITSSLNTKLNPKATSSRTAFHVTKSLDAVVRSLSGIPKFEQSKIRWVSFPEEKVGSGRFGIVKLVKLTDLDLIVACKVLDENTNKNAIFAEVVASMTLSGNEYFPYCFGMLEENMILMQFIRHPKFENHPAPTFQSYLHEGNLEIACFKSICIDILSGVKYMHGRKILHNDLKADNVLVSSTTKIIDFGKATLVTEPVIYNIHPGSAENKLYNSQHRHLAYELRNVPGSKQSVYTDAYSLGHMFKHAAAKLNYNPIIELGKMMKDQNVACRISIENALDKMKLI